MTSRNNAEANTGLLSNQYHPYTPVQQNMYQPAYNQQQQQQQMQQGQQLYQPVQGQQMQQQQQQQYQLPPVQPPPPSYNTSIGDQKVNFEFPLASQSMRLAPQSMQAFYQRPLLKAVVNGRPMFGQVDVFLDQGESVLADAGSMTWMDGSLTIDTSMKDGCMAACGRSCSSESCCLNTYTGPGRVGFGFPLPGDIMAFAVTPEFGWVVSQGAFVCGSPNIKVSGRFAGCGAALCAGEGLFLTKITTEREPGLFFAGGFGSIKQHIVPPGRSFFVDRGMFFAAEQNTKLNVGLIGGLKTMCCTGEGFVMKFYGPCIVYTQSRNPKLLQPQPSEPTTDSMAQ